MNEDDAEVTVSPRRAEAQRSARPAKNAPAPKVEEDPVSGTELSGTEAEPYAGKEGWETFEAGELYVAPKKQGADAGARKRPSDPMPEGTFLFNTGKDKPMEDTEVYTGVRGKWAEQARQAGGAIGERNYGVVDMGRRPGAGPSAASGSSAPPSGPSGAPSTAAPSVPAPSHGGYTLRKAPASDESTVVYDGSAPRVQDNSPTPLRPLPPGPLRVLVIGSGAREHAMAAAVARSKRAELFVATRHRNPGLVKLAASFRLLAETDVAGIVAWARQQKVQLAVIGPEAALQAGLADSLRHAGIQVASPTQAAARIETSKTFMRQLMARHMLPGQLAFHPFTDRAAAIRFLDENGPVWAIKPVGLTGGKGVQVHGDHFKDLAGAKSYTDSVFAGQVGGGAVQFEELARGEEYTLMAFTDGTHLVPMPAVQDHKRLRDGDQGPNTGGMGSYSCPDGLLPFLGAADYSDSVAILQAIVDALRADGTPYVGAIYGQFMLTAAGPKVIEVNARFGDPEAMNCLHLLETDYVEVLAAMAEGRLSGAKVAFRPRATVVRYIVPNGYGEGTAYPSHLEVDEFNIRRAGAMLYYAHVEPGPGGGLMTMRSRALAMLGEGATVADAEKACTAGLRHIHGDGLFVRMDIGTAALLERRVEHMRTVRPVA